jgi:SAM-dependent methyltransferase
MRRIALLEDITRAFEKMEDWHAFSSENSFISSRPYIDEIANHAKVSGVDSAFWGYVPPSRVQILSPNYREHLIVNGLNSRQRAVLELIAAEPRLGDIGSAKIYAAEAVTPFALALRGRYPRFIGSEYASSPEAKSALFPISTQNLLALDFPDAAFDCAVTNDCLEHVPDLKAALRELCRIVRLGGVMLSTFPFTYRETGVVKAKLIGDQIEYLTEAEYHGNPIDPAGGSLVFQIPGWDILDHAREAGFSKAEMVFLGGPERAISAVEVSGIFVLRCYR